MISASQLHKAFPTCRDPEGWVAALAVALPRFHIDNPERECAFLAQIGYESGEFNHLTESLFYTTPQQLVKVFPTRFHTIAEATPYLRNEAKLGNFVYAGRMGNGDEGSGDGFLYRGRGLIQLTGRSNYEQASLALNLPLVTHPETVATPEVAALTAAWFWESRGLNALADDGTDDNDLEDFRKITQLINGGTSTVTQRLALFHVVQQALH